MADIYVPQREQTLPKVNIRGVSIFCGLLFVSILGLVAYFVTHTILLYLFPRGEYEGSGVVLFRDVVMPLMPLILIRISVWEYLTKDSPIPEGHRGVVKLLGKRHPQLEFGEGMICTFGDIVGVSIVDVRGSPFKLRIMNILTADGVTIESLEVTGEFEIIDSYMLLSKNRVLGTDRTQGTLENLVESTTRTRIGGTDSMKVIEVSAKKTAIASDIMQSCKADLEKLGVCLISVNLGEPKLPQSIINALLRKRQQEGEREGRQVMADGIVDTITRAKKAEPDFTPQDLKHISLAVAGVDVKVIAVDGTASPLSKGAVLVGEETDKKKGG